MRISEIGGVYVLELEGSLDVESSEDMKKEALRVCEMGRGMVLDLRNLSYIDSIGIGSIVSVFRKCSSVGKRLVLVATEGNVLDVLKMTRLDKLIDIFKSVSEAIRSFE